MTAVTAGATPDPVVRGELRSLSAEIARSDRVVPVGGRTQWEVGGIPSGGVEIRAPAGVLTYDPADLTATVSAGTTVAELRAVLAEQGQLCPLDPRDDKATVGGVLATGLSGHRRLRFGPVRDTLLGARFFRADGSEVRAGGPTVKNVTGYDLCRLLVGSLGTLGVITEVTLRCVPCPPTSVWGTTDEEPEAVVRRLFAPSCVLSDGTTTSVLLEGSSADVASQFDVGGLGETEHPPAFPEGPHRGRISVPPESMSGVREGLARTAGVRFLAETGVGTVHVAASTPEDLVQARGIAEESGGWMLREQGGGDIDPFGVAFPAQTVMQRIRDAFDPTRKFSPGRLPL